MVQLSYQRPEWLSTSQRGRTNELHDNQQESRRKLWLCPHESVDFQEAGEVLANQDPAKTCEGATCQNTFAQVFSTEKRSKHGSRMLQLVTSVNLFDIRWTCHPEEAIRRWCSLDRIATVLRGLDLPICPHLNLSSPYLLSHLDLHSLPVLPENQYANMCHCKTAASPCSTSSHCTTCHQAGIKTAFFLQANRVVRGTRHIKTRLNIRLNIVRNLGALHQPLDPAWLTHSLSPGDLHRAAAAWQSWEAGFISLWRLRRSWASDLGAVDQIAEGEILDCSHGEVGTLLSRLLQRDGDDGSYRGGPSVWESLSSFWEERKTRRQLREATRDSFRELAAAPDSRTFFLDSVRKFGARQTFKEVWSRQRDFCARLCEGRHEGGEVSEQDEGGEGEESHLLGRWRRRARERDEHRRRKGRGYTPPPPPTVTGDDLEDAWALLQWREEVERRRRREQRERTGRPRRSFEMYP